MPSEKLNMQYPGKLYKAQGVNILAFEWIKAIMYRSSRELHNNINIITV